MADAFAPPAPTPEQMRARYAEARARLVRHALIWGAIALVALAVSVGTYLSAQGAAEAGTDNAIGNRYFVFWGPVVFGGWRAIQSAIGAARLSDEARRLG